MTVDLDALVEGAWVEFRDAFAEAVDGLAEGDKVLAELDPGHDIDEVPPHVMAQRTHGALRLTMPGNRHLADPLRLSKAGRRHLRSLGLQRPSDETPHHWATYPTGHADEVASIAVSALRDGYGVVHPSFLVSEDFTWTINSELPEPVRSSGTPLAIHPVDRTHLDQLIDAALTPMLGEAPERDEDGDIPVRVGSAVVFIRSRDRRPLIHLFAQVVLGVSDTDAALHEVAELNHDVDGVKFVLDGDTVVAAIDVLAVPFAPQHLQLLLGHICRVVEKHDAALARRVGGMTFIEAVEAARKPAVEVHPVMQRLLQLDAGKPGSVRAKDAAKLCGYDCDLLLELIEWTETQEIAHSKARDHAYALEQYDDAAAYESELAQARRTTKVLRKALRRVLLR